MSRLPKKDRERLEGVLEDYRRWHCFVNATIIARQAELKKHVVEAELLRMIEEEELDRITVSYIAPGASKRDLGISEDCYRLPESKSVMRESLLAYYRSKAANAQKPGRSHRARKSKIIEE